MLSSNIDLGPLINPLKEPMPLRTKIIDVSSWVLPTGAAILAIIGGVEALYDVNTLAAICGIASGIASAAGIIATGKASKMRDHRLELALAVGNLGIKMAERAMTSFRGE